MYIHIYPMVRLSLQCPWLRAPLISAGRGQRTSHGAEAEDAESGESTESPGGERSSHEVGVKNGEYWLILVNNG